MDSTMRTAGAAVVAMVLGLGPVAVSAAGGSDSTTASWRLRGVAGLPSETRIALARASEPLWYAVPPGPALSLQVILDRVCARQPADTKRFLADGITRLNQAAGIDEMVEPGEVVAVPFCLVVRRDVPVRATAGESPSEILKREYGVYGQKTVAAFYERNAALPQFTGYRDFVERLPADQPLILPYAAPERVFAQSSGVAETVPSIIGALPEGIRGQMANSVAPAPLDDDRMRYRLRFVQSVDTSRDPGDGACSGPRDEAAMAVDRALLTARFAAESAALRLFRQREPVPTVVGILDTGLATVGDIFFDRRFFLPNAPELNGDDDTDDDGNGHVDDVYGTNFYSRSGIIEPLATDLNGDHGTKMATLVLGGLRQAPVWLTGAANPPIRLRIVNYSSQHPNAETVNPAILPEALLYLEKTGARVVNLSLATSEKLLVFKNTLKDLDDLLFVAAAGNARSGKGSNLGTISLFPARYGGVRGFDHVVTVGAHDRSGKTASFSNWSSEYVDLLAPGCAVETRDHKGSVVLDTGTSPATASVSFAAGLVQALGIEKPPAIKNRLLLGTDFDPRLRAAVWSSGRLDILKTISLHHDVIDTGGTPRGLVFGRLVRPGDLLRFCVDMAPGIDRRDLRKIIPNQPADGSGATMEYWIEVDGQLSKGTCRQEHQEESIGRVVVDGVESDGPRLQQIREVVLATFRRK